MLVYFTFVINYYLTRVNFLAFEVFIFKYLSIKRDVITVFELEIFTKDYRQHTHQKHCQFFPTISVRYFGPRVLHQWKPPSTLAEQQRPDERRCEEG